MYIRIYSDVKISVACSERKIFSKVYFLVEDLKPLATVSRIGSSLMGR